MHSVRLTQEPQLLNRGEDEDLTRNLGPKSSSQVQQFAVNH